MLPEESVLRRLKNILFLDIETVSATEDLNMLPERLIPFWRKKHSSQFAQSFENPEDSYFEKAAIFAEFGKIIVIGLGFFYVADNQLKLKVTSIFNHDEKALLKNFIQVLNNFANISTLELCAHNGREFDFPYLGRRILVNKLALPEVLELSNKKPWEVRHLDTMEMWKFGDKKSYTSLDLLASLFNIATSKDVMDGSMVNTVYYEEKDLGKIADYCKKDIITLAQLYLALNSIELVASNCVQVV